MTRAKRAVLAIVLGAAVSIAGISRRAVVLYPFGDVSVWNQTFVRAQTEADAVPNDLVNLFAKVVLEIEPYRVEALEASNNAIDEREKDDIQRNFIRQATEIVESNGLAVADYNRITIQIRQDSDLREQIEAAIRGLQQDGA